MDAGEKHPEHGLEEPVRPASGEAERSAVARREVLKAIGITSGVLAVQAFIPRTWCGPVVELARLPAHAATSANCQAAVLTATRTTNGQVMLTWTGATGALDIYRQATGESAKKLVGILDAEVSSYLDVTADPKMAYEYTFQGNCAAKAAVGVVP
jgi:hypothetical protein